jgi:hypothetical protein
MERSQMVARRKESCDISQSTPNNHAPATEPGNDYFGPVNAHLQAAFGKDHLAIRCDRGAAELKLLPQFVGLELTAVATDGNAGEGPIPSAVKRCIVQSFPAELSTAPPAAKRRRYERCNSSIVFPAIDPKVSLMTLAQVAERMHAGQPVHAKEQESDALAVQFEEVRRKHEEVRPKNIARRAAKVSSFTSRALARCSNWFGRVLRG